jgi:exodeoxyribonuclease VII large subunit
VPEPRPDPIPGSVFAGPFPVGSYAARLRDKLRDFAKVQVFGEVVGFKVTRARVYFELRDATGALPCSMWRTDWDVLRIPPLRDGVQIVAQGGCDYYPGSRQSSPGFSFAVDSVHVAGEGDLLAQLAQLRRKLEAEGRFEPQKTLARPSLPRCIGVVTGETGKARDDVVAGLQRRGWAGRLVWAFAPVQDRHAAVAVGRALQDLASCPEVEVIIVARGGGSLMDLFAFCDETLCRTVSMLRVPVIASVGHHTDRTLIDDVAAVSCSTPTHAAEAAVPIHCGEARARVQTFGARLETHSLRPIETGAPRLATHGVRLATHGRRPIEIGGPQLASLGIRLATHARRSVLERARTLAALSRAPAAHVERHRATLHQHLREIRAASDRGVELRSRDVATRALVLRRKGDATAGELPRGLARAATAARSLTRSGATVARGRARAADEAASLTRVATTTRRRADLERLSLALAAHEPQRTLERGYALIEGPDGEPVTSAATARSLDRMKLRLHDGTVDVRPEDER